MSFPLGQFFFYNRRVLYSHKQCKKDWRQLRESHNDVTADTKQTLWSKTHLRKRASLQSSFKYLCPLCATLRGKRYETSRISSWAQRTTLSRNEPDLPTTRTSKNTLSTHTHTHTHTKKKKKTHTHTHTTLLIRNLAYKKQKINPPGLSYIRGVLYPYHLKNLYWWVCSRNSRLWICV
jgi:hypothetical protein